MITVNYGITLRLKGKGKRRVSENHQGLQLDLKENQSKKIREEIRKRHPGWIVEGFAIVDNLLSACKAQHKAIDILFALLIGKDKKFFPIKSGQPWEALQQGNRAIKDAEAKND